MNTANIAGRKIILNRTTGGPTGSEPFRVGYVELWNRPLWMCTMSVIEIYREEKDAGKCELVDMDDLIVIVTLCKPWICYSKLMFSH